MRYAIPAIVSIYTIVWLPFGVLQLVTDFWPKNAVQWGIVLGNPFALTLIAALLKRHWDRKSNLA